MKLKAGLTVREACSTVDVDGIATECGAKTPLQNSSTDIAISRDLGKSRELRALACAKGKFCVFSRTFARLLALVEINK